MSGFENTGSNRDLKKLLGNPKITFILGNSLPSHSSIYNRWSSLWKGYTMCKVSGRVRVYSHLRRGFDEVRDSKGK